jgi:hypothetical protein
MARIGKSVPWKTQEADDSQQELEYQVKRMDMQRRMLQVWTGRLEAALSRHWPEVNQLLKCNSATLLQVLIEHGSPAALAADEKARGKLKSWSRDLLSEQTIERLLASAVSTVGVRMGRWDIRHLRDLAEGAQAARKQVSLCARRLAQLTIGHGTIQAMRQVVGLSTSCVLWICLGDPHQYHCAGAYVKAMGLNLKERSSGIYQGRLKISKRGYGMVRYWLYLAAMRWLKQREVKQWFEAKKQRDGNKGGKAMVGVMRRVGTALYHVGAMGEAFEPSRLFGSCKLKKAKGR